MLAATPKLLFAAGPTAATIDSIKVGFDGHYKIGYWTPIDVVVSAGRAAIEGELQIVVPDGDGVPTRVVQHVSLAAGEQRSIRMYVKFGRPHSAISVSLVSRDDSVTRVERVFAGDEVPQALPTEHKLILELGSALEFGSGIRFSEEGEPEGTTIVHLPDPGTWPNRACGYAGVDYVLLTTADPAIFQKASRESLDALEAWLRGGGRMILSVGRHATELVADDMPLARFAPGKFAGITQLNRFGAFESFARTAEPLDAAIRAGERRAIDVAHIADVQGQVLAYEGNRPVDLPLIVRRGFGFGVLTFVAADLDAPPISRWGARTELLAALLGREAGAIAARPAEGRAGQGMLGFDDMAGQLRAAIDRFPDVRLTPFWLVATLGIGYVVLLFPLDYLLRRRGGTGQRSRPVPGRGEEVNNADGLPALGDAAESDSFLTAPTAAWAWLRLALWIIGVSCGIGLLGAQWKSGRIEVSSAEAVDFDVESGQMRGNSWLSLYCPSSQTVDLEIKPQLSAAAAKPGAAELSWFGLPGSGLGGMNPPPAQVEPTLFTQPYTIGAETPAAESVPIATWSSKCFTASWTGSNARPLKADLRDSAEGQLTGTIRLADDAADLKLTDCVLLYERSAHERWAYPIGPLSSGRLIQVDRIDPFTIETLFTQQTASSGERESATLYDRASLHRQRVLEIMLFYKAAGGSRYTGLLNRYLHTIDLSDQLALGRAILIGKGQPASTLQANGQPITTNPSENVTWYRFLIPVQKGAPPPSPSGRGPG